MSAARTKPRRVRALRGIGVDKVGDSADAERSKFHQGHPAENMLRLENLDVNIPADPVVQEVTQASISNDDYNSYLPFLGQHELRNTAAAHVSQMANEKVKYDGNRNCVITAGGLSGILNVLLAVVEEGDGVIMTDPTYAGFLNRVKLAGGIPIFAPLIFSEAESWKLDPTALKALFESPKVKPSTMLIMSPSMPSGYYFSRDDWQLISDLCVEHNLILIVDTAMERLLFDQLEVFHPASLPGMAERTVTVGSASKELRMIGWRVGWVVGPEDLIDDVAKVSMANVVVPVGIAQRAASEALKSSYESLDGYVEELQKRRDLCIRELKGLPYGKPDGGWSLVIRLDSLGWGAAEASKALFDAGVAMTPMTGWGSDTLGEFIRIMFSNESCERLEGVGEKIRKVLRKEKNEV